MKQDDFFLNRITNTRKWEMNHPAASYGELTHAPQPPCKKKAAANTCGSFLK